MNSNLTELVFILDRSGSMSGLESDTIGGFNSMIEKQKKEEGEAFVTTVLFDSKIETIHDRVNLKEISPMTEKEYYVRGCTALLDAVGYAVTHISDIHKYARPEDVPAHTVFVITTDGMENASRSYGKDEIKRMTEQRKNENGWEFLFLGANMDAVETAAGIGISRERAVNYNCDGYGTALNYRVVSDAVSSVRACAPLGDDWKQEIEEDYKRRKV